MPTLYCHDQDEFSTSGPWRFASGPYESLGDRLLADCPADMDVISVFTGTLIANDAGGYYWYYTAMQCRGGNHMAINLAMSDDGITWRKEPLGQVQIDGADSCRLKIEGLPEAARWAQPMVHRLANGSWRMYFWLHGGGKDQYVRYVVAVSDDGLHWRCDDIEQVCVYHPADDAMPEFDWAGGLVTHEPRKNGSSRLDQVTAKRRSGNDATFVVRDPKTGLWEMYGVWLLPNPAGSPRRCEHDNAPGVLRTIQRRTSADGLTWSDPELILVPDEQDPLDQQFYHLGVHYLGERRVGFLGHYRVDAQTMDIEICFSRDGLHWNRPLRRGWIQRDPPGGLGSMSAYPCKGIIERDDNWLIPYNAGNVKHNAHVRGETENWRNVGRMIRIPKHRLVGLQTAGDRGKILTQPFIVGAQGVRLDAAVRGSLRYSLCDPFGGVLPGCSADQCLPLEGDRQDHTLRWAGGISTDDFRFDAVRLQLELQDATFYALHY